MVSFEESANNYEVWSHLGSVCGGMGAVFLAKHKPSNSQLAIKIYELDKCGDEFELIEHEIRTVKNLRHPNIIQYMTSFATSQQLWIVMPLLGYTSASRLVASHFTDGLSEPALALVTKEVLQGLQYLHSKHIIHRSVRGSHILIDNDGRVVLSGLRHSLCISDNTTRFKKSTHSYPPQAKYNLNWSSPELLEQDLYGYSEKSDIYSLGIVVCELGNGEVPYRDIPPTLMLLEKLEDRVPYLYDASTCPQPENGQVMATDSGVGGSVGDNLTSMAITQRLFTPSAHDIVTKALARHPRHRPTAEDLLHHPFIKQTRRFHATLPQFLHPVVPLNQQSEIDDAIPDLLEDSIERISLNDDEISWDF